MNIEKAQSLLKALGFEACDLGDLGTVYARHNADGTVTGVGTFVRDEMKFVLPSDASDPVVSYLVHRDNPRDQLAAADFEQFKYALAALHAFSPRPLSDPLLEAVVTIRDLASHHFLDRHVGETGVWPSQGYLENHRQICRLALGRAGLGDLPQTKDGVPILEAENA